MPPRGLSLRLPQATPATLSASVAGPVAQDCGRGLHRSRTSAEDAPGRGSSSAAGSEVRLLPVCSGLLCGLRV